MSGSPKDPFTPLEFSPEPEGEDKKEHEKWAERTRLKIRNRKKRLQRNLDSLVKKDKVGKEAAAQMERDNGEIVDRYKRDNPTSTRKLAPGKDKGIAKRNNAQRNERYKRKREGEGKSTRKYFKRRSPDAAADSPTPSQIAETELNYARLMEGLSPGEAETLESMLRASPSPTLQRQQAAFDAAWTADGNAGLAGPSQIPQAAASPRAPLGFVDLLTRQLTPPMVGAGSPSPRASPGRASPGGRAPSRSSSPPSILRSCPEFVPLSLEPVPARSYSPFPGLPPSPASAPRAGSPSPAARRSGSRSRSKSKPASPAPRRSGSRSKSASPAPRRSRSASRPASPAPRRPRSTTRPSPARRHLPTLSPAAAAAAAAEEATYRAFFFGNRSVRRHGVRNSPEGTLPNIPYRLPEVGLALRESTPPETTATPYWASPSPPPSAQRRVARRALAKPPRHPGKPRARGPTRFKPAA